MGGGVPRGGPPNQAAYYVALVSILFLLILLCCYFCYFFISKIKELSQQDTPSTTPSATQARPGAGAYPVQPVIRDSATAMAALCKQVPAPGARGGTVFPAASSPAAQQADLGGQPAQPAAAPPARPPDAAPAPPKLLAPAASPAAPAAAVQAS